MQGSRVLEQWPHERAGVVLVAEKLAIDTHSGRAGNHVGRAGACFVGITVRTCRSNAELQIEFARRRVHQLSEQKNRLDCRVPTPAESHTCHLLDRYGVKHQVRDDSYTTSAATQPPEQICVGHMNLSIGSDNRRLGQEVRGAAEVASALAKPAAKH